MRIGWSARLASAAGPVHVAGDGGLTGDGILVVGAGLAGLTTALALARCGHRVHQVERRPLDAAVADGRTTAIGAAGQALYAAIGAWEFLAPHAEPILDIRVRDGASRRYLAYDHRSAGDSPMGYIVENHLLHRTLLAQVLAEASVTQHRGAGVVRLDAQGATIGVELDDGTTLRAGLLVGADGRDSAIRRCAGIAAARWDYNQTAMVCTLAHARPHDNVAYEWFWPGGPLAVLPMTRRRSSVVWTEQRPTAQALAGLDEREFADALDARFEGMLGELEIVGRRWVFPLSLVQARRRRAARLVLVGDAAQALHPIAGQGFNLALRDVAELAEQLARARRLGLDPGDPELLRRYEAARSVDVTALTVATHGLNRLFSNAAVPVRAARQTGLAIVQRSPGLKRMFMRRGMGVGGNLPALLAGRLP